MPKGMQTVGEYYVSASISSLEVSNAQMHSASLPTHCREDGRKMPDKKKWSK